MKKRALAIALALCIAATNAAGAFAAEAEAQVPQIVEEEIGLEESTEAEWDEAEAEPADNAEETIDQIEEKQEETEGEISEADPETENEQKNDPESLETAEENPETETEENTEEPVDDITDQDPSESEKEEPAEGQEYSAEAVGEGTEDGNTNPTEENSNKADCQLFDTEVIYTGKEITPAVEVIYQGTLLEEGTNYQLTYDNNVNVGIGTVTVEATDNSFEPVTLSFKILPAASKKVTIYNVAQGLKVTWLKVEGATRYNVYRDGELIKTTSVLEITDGDVKYRSGEKFTYKVVATAKDVGESTVARTGTYYRLMPVGIKSVTNSGAGKMTVTYDKSPGSSGYVVRYGLESDMSDAKVITVKGENTTSRTFSNLTKGKMYYVQVRTYKIENDIRYYSGYCTTKTVKISKPTVKTLGKAPTITVKKDEDFKNIISWKAVEDADGYEVCYKKGANGTWARVGYTTSTQSTQKVTHGVKYFYRVRAFQDLANGSRVYGDYSAEKSMLQYYQPSFNVFMTSDSDPDKGTFVLLVENTGKATIRFYSKDAFLRDNDYVKFHRDLYLTKTTGSSYISLEEATYRDVKPGVSAFIVFACKGDNTWYDKKTRIYYTIRCDGVDYNAVSSYYFGSSFAAK